MSAFARTISLLLVQGLLLVQALRSPDKVREGQPLDVNLKKSSSPMRMTIQNVKQGIAAHIPGFEPPLLTRRDGVAAAYVGSGLKLNRACRITEGNQCPLSSLAQGEPTMIFPGGKTRCIFGSEFAFQVWPADPDKLLIYLEGGGACWDDVTTIFKALCKSFVYPSDLMGFFNKCPGDTNPFANHTVVYVQACSGDLHSGSVKRPWEGPGGQVVEQRGLDNVRAAIDWVKANLPNKFTDLALSGESAGAIGVQIWASTLLKELQYDSASVLADSYVGIFPPGFQGPVFRELNVCDSGLLNDKLRERCLNEDLTIADVYESTMKEFPHVAFGSLNSKHDVGQIMFYNLAATTVQVQKIAKFCADQGNDECDMTSASPDMLVPQVPLAFNDFHNRMDEVIDRYSAQPNYASYVMSAGMHTVTPFVYGDCPMIDYSKGPAGTMGFWEGATGAQRRDLREWLKAFFFQHSSLKSVCEKLLAQDDDDYCHTVQEQKALTL